MIVAGPVPSNWTGMYKKQGPGAVSGQRPLNMTVCAYSLRTWQTSPRRNQKEKKMVNPMFIHNLLNSRARRRALLFSVAVVTAIAGCATRGAWRPEPVTVPQILAMAKSGVPADDIISKMKASGTAYRLKANQLANLENEGVPAKVINYMQQTYLDAVRRDTKYQDWQYWNMEDDFWYGGYPYGWPDYP